MSKIGDIITVHDERDDEDSPAMVLRVNDDGSLRVRVFGQSGTDATLDYVDDTGKPYQYPDAQPEPEPAAVTTFGAAGPVPAPLEPIFTPPAAASSASSAGDNPAPGTPAFDAAVDAEIARRQAASAASSSSDASTTQLLTQPGQEPKPL